MTHATAPSSSGLRIALTVPRAHFDVDVDVQLPLSGVTAIFGASGSGKTSVLRAVAGLEPQARGRVHLGTQTWLDTAQGVQVPTHERALGMVFQEASLFDHLDVQGNLRFGLVRSKGRASAQTLQEAVELLGIGHLLHRDTRSLSGGERQRVAIARALATGPRVLLLDEPLAALDAARRQDILPWLETLRRESGIPMLYVTHALDEVARLADTLWVLQDGRTQALGPVTQVLGAVRQPELWGDEAGALFDARVVARDAAWGLAQVAFAGGRLWLRDSGLHVGQSVRVRVLARDVSVTRSRAVDTSIQNHLSCTVQALWPDAHPSQCWVQLRCVPEATSEGVRSHEDALLLARITARAAHALQLAEGQPVWAQVKSVALIR
jgi:molybdate transport system ATP-binding protein